MINTPEPGGGRYGKVGGSSGSTTLESWSWKTLQQLLIEVGKGADFNRSTIPQKETRIFQGDCGITKEVPEIPNPILCKFVTGQEKNKY